MQFQNNFDLEEFLAYLLPGFLVCSIALAEYGGLYATLFSDLKQNTGDLFSTFILIVVFIVFSIILGQISSIFSRFIFRSILNAVFGDPERFIFGRSGGKFFSPSINKIIADRFAYRFGFQITDPEIEPAVPRLIRSYVFTRSDTVVVARERIVRSRSICANLVTPLFYLALAGPLGSTPLTRLLTALVAILLLVKQRDLDIRESKEIYMAFISLPPVENDIQESPK